MRIPNSLIPWLLVSREAVYQNEGKPTEWTFLFNLFSLSYLENKLILRPWNQLEVKRQDCGRPQSSSLPKSSAACAANFEGLLSTWVLWIFKINLKKRKFSPGERHTSCAINDACGILSWHSCHQNSIRTTHTLGALVWGIVNKVSCASLYHYTHRENTPVSYESKFQMLYYRCKVIKFTFKNHP